MTKMSSQSQQKRFNLLDASQQPMQPVYLARVWEAEGGRCLDGDQSLKDPVIGMRSANLQNLSNQYPSLSPHLEKALGSLQGGVPGKRPMLI